MGIRGKNHSTPPFNASPRAGQVVPRATTVSPEATSGRVIRWLSLRSVDSEQYRGVKVGGPANWTTMDNDRVKGQGVQISEYQ